MASFISALPDPEEERIADQMAMANALRKKGMAMDTGAGYHGGKVFMVGNALGPIAQGLAGAYMANRAQNQQAELTKTRQAQRDAFMAQMPQATQQTPTPELNDQGAPIMAETPRDARTYAREMRDWGMKAATIPGMEGIGAATMQQAMLAPEKQADRELQNELATKQLLIKSAEARQAREEQDARRLDSDKIFKMTAQTQADLAQQKIDAAKDIAAAKVAAAKEKEDAKKIAADQAKAGAMDLAQQQVNSIDTMIGTFDPKTGARLTEAHPGFGGYVGATLLPFKRLIEGTNEASYDKLHKQVTSQARLEGIKMLKGTGSVSNAEGAAAASAITRMDKAASETEYMTAAREYREIIQRGLDRMQSGQSAGSGQPSSGGGYEQTKTIPGKGTFGLRNGQWYPVQ